MNKERKKDHLPVSYVLGLLLIASFLISCGGKSRILEREDLFSIQFGVMSDELEYLYRDNFLLPGSSKISMEEGIFRISNESMGKIMVFNSYGDLISLIYDPLKNINYESINREKQGGATNLSFSEWGFKRPGGIAFNDKYTFVVDYIESENVVFDEELNASCNKIVLRFNDKGKYIDYLGMDGIGGKPFPFIQNIRLRDNGDIVVISRLSDGWIVFWYDESGVPRYRIKIDNEHYPLLDDEYIPSLSRLEVDPERYRLYATVNHYPENSEKDNNGAVKTLYKFDLATSKFSESIHIPDEILKEDGKETKYVYDLVGVAGSGNLLLMSPVGNNDFYIAGLNEKGKTLFKRKISLGDERVVFSDFFLNREGILTALRYNEEKAVVSWWRTDRLF